MAGFPFIQQHEEVFFTKKRQELQAITVFERSQCIQNESAITDADTSETEVASSVENRSP